MYSHNDLTEFVFCTEKGFKECNVAIIIERVVEVVEMTKCGTVSAVIVIRAVAVIISHIVSDIADEPSDA